MQRRDCDPLSPLPITDLLLTTSVCFDEATVDSGSLSGPRQITDIYLLALAVAHGARFVTLDKHVPLGIVREADEESLVAI